MRYYFAPMEGVTDVLYRQTHHACFTGVSKYFIPFVSPSSDYSFTQRDRFEWSWQENAGIPTVPQVLVCNAEYMIHMAQVFQDCGYTEVNINLGCPSGTVTAKGKGAGFLRKPDDLRRFLDEVYTHSVLPVSLKTRIGYDAVEEWGRLAEIFRSYPIHELIVHPRTRQEFYRGEPHMEAFSAVRDFPFPLVYNGNVFRKEDAERIAQEYPEIDAIMMGRGLLANPALARYCQGGAALSKDEMIAFHDKLYETYMKRWPEKAVPGHMHEICKYLCWCFEQSDRSKKALWKANTIADYDEAAWILFHTCEFKEDPAFIPPY